MAFDDSTLLLLHVARYEPSAHRPKQMNQKPSKLRQEPRLVGLSVAELGRVKLYHMA